MTKATIVALSSFFIPALLTVESVAQVKDLKAVSIERLAKSRAELEEARRVAAERGWIVSGVDATGQGISLQRLAPNGMPVYFVTCNGMAATATRTDSLWPYVGGAGGEMIYMWDEGEPRYAHQEFGGRVGWADASSPGTSNHSTHVAGTLVNSGGFHSPNEPYRGMAYQADLTAYDWNNDLAEMTGVAAGSILLSNHSYSEARGWLLYAGTWYWRGDVTVSTTEDYLFGFYDDRAHDLDSLANAAPDYLMVMSAGNDRDDFGPTPPDSHLYYDPDVGDMVWSTDPRDPDGGVDGYDCLPAGGQVAKNVLTVGATDCTYFLPPTYDPQYIDMMAMSSWGPTDDGRIKPDLVGDGHRLWSSWGTANDAYDDQSGTSQAAPNVTGSLALLQEAYRNRHGGTPMRAATLKALAIHTAVDVGDEGPDYEFGWGLPNFDAAHDIIVEDDVEGGLINEITITEGDTLYLSFCRPYYGPYKTIFTLCWSDPEATPLAPSLDPTTPMLVNDLDMRVIYERTEYQPWVLDPSNPSNAATTGDNFRDNVERREFFTGSTGTFVVRITHKGTLTGGSQDFSLIASQVRKPNSYHVYANGTGDFVDITTAANNTECGDTILVHGGTYNEHDIVFGDHQVVIGVDGPENTAINAQDLGRCVYLGENAILEGFTLENGTKTGAGTDGQGGGVYVSQWSEVRDCIVEENVANEGGGVYSSDNAIVKNCVIRENTAWDDGGGVHFAGYGYPRLDGCLVAGNVANDDGGGVYAPQAWLTIQSCTIAQNLAPNNAAGLHCYGDRVDIDNSIVAFNQSLITGAGVYTTTSTIDIACCDVYGNNAGNYGGGIGDQTGSNDNISADPEFCDAGSDDYSLYDSSPCAPASSPCGMLVGVYDIGCTYAAELEIESVVFTETNPVAGSTIYATVVVRNTSPNPVGSFAIDYYEDRGSPPSVGQAGDQRLLVSGLAAGDFVEWTTDAITSACFSNWESYFQVDTDNSVAETNEGNNISGAHDVQWQIPMAAGWPAAGHGDFLGSPAIAPLDDDVNTLEVVVGDVAGYLHAVDYAGVELPGWPVNVGDSLVSSPAVGDIAGDSHMEVVIGCVDGYLYAYNYLGNQLWSHNAGDPMLTTPALADLDDDGKLEVVFANSDGKTGSYVNALEGNGTAYPGAWPYNMGGPHATSPAVGDVDRSGGLEIAVVSYGMTSPAPYSEVFLLNSNGAVFGSHWPVTIDTVVVASPVIGDIAATIGDHLELVVGGLDGVVYAISSGGGIWPFLPRVAGKIERSPALVNSDKDSYQEILVGSRYWFEYAPPFGRYQGGVTLIDNTGDVVSGWPEGIGSWLWDGAVPSPVALKNRILVGTPAGSINGWDNTGNVTDGFALDVNGVFSSSVAVGDLDGDGYLELVGATHVDSIYSYDLGCGTSYVAAMNTEWPMFRNGRTRCGCYCTETITGVDGGDDDVPAETALRSVFPNPFNPATRISFELARSTHVYIAVYDVAGRRIRVLKDAVSEEGRHEVVWDGSADNGRVAVSGVYFCQLRAEGVFQTKKMVLLK